MNLKIFSDRKSMYQMYLDYMRHQTNDKFKALVKSAFDWKNNEKIRGETYTKINCNDGTCTILHCFAASGLDKFFVEQNFCYKYRPKNKLPDKWRSIQTVDKHHLTPLHYAAMNGQTRTLTILLDLLDVGKRTCLFAGDNCLTVNDVLRFRIHSICESGNIPLPGCSDSLGAGTRELVVALESIQRAHSIVPAVAVPHARDLREMIDAAVCLRSRIAGVRVCVPAG